MTDLKTLIGSYFDGGLTDEQSRELSRCLVDSPATRRAMWEHAQQEVLLEQLVEESRGKAQPGRWKPEVPAKDSSVVAPTQSTITRISGFLKSRRLRRLSAAAVLLFLATVASAAVFPPMRGVFVRWWHAVAASLPMNEPRDVAQENSDQEATGDPKPNEIAEQATEQKDAEPAKPTPKPALKDEQ